MPCESQHMVSMFLSMCESGVTRYVMTQLHHVKVLKSYRITDERKLTSPVDVNSFVVLCACSALLQELLSRNFLWCAEQLR